MHRSSLVALAGLVAFAPAPASAMTALPPSWQMSADQLATSRAQYIAVMCPGVRYAPKLTKSLDRWTKGASQIRVGTAVPKQVRVRSEAYARLMQNRATRLGAGAWPQDLLTLLQLKQKEAKSAAKYFSKRSTPTVRASWPKSYYQASQANGPIADALQIPAGVNAC